MAYEFAQNPAKLNRAIATLQQQVKDKVRSDFKEADVKELYIKYAGLLVAGTEEEEEIAIEDMTMPQLKKLAKEREIVIKDLSREEIIAALQA